MRNFVEPFFGSGATLLGRPTPFSGTETVNDKDGFIANFWRALQHDPDAVASHADRPVNENDMHAIHAWLVGQRESLVPKLEGDPDYFDVKVAGWWAWGICCWIGGRWCSGKGPWHQVEMADGSRQLVHLGDAGQGVNRRRVHLGNGGQGVNRQRVHLGTGGNGMQTTKVGESLYTWMHALANRLRRVRVCCGDWRRVCGPTPTVHQGLTAVFLDPPYANDLRDNCCYCEDDVSLSGDVRLWCLERGDDPQIRIVLCGYEGEHEMPASWQCVPWKAHGGYGSRGNGRGRDNAGRERLWLSPHCLSAATQIELF